MASIQAPNRGVWSNVASRDYFPNGLGRLGICSTIGRACEAPPPVNKALNTRIRFVAPGSVYFKVAPESVLVLMETQCTRSVEDCMTTSWPGSAPRERLKDPLLMFNDEPLSNFGRYVPSGTV